MEVISTNSKRRPKRRLFKKAEYEIVDDGNFVFDEYYRTLRLESELSDLRVDNVNPIRAPNCERTKRC